MKARALLSGAVLLGVSAAAWASEYRGLVLYNGLPVPGATVTVTQGTKHFSAVTDMQGFYSFADLADGTATLDVQMTGFAKIEKPITVAADAAVDHAELQMFSPEQMRAELKPEPSAPIAQVQARSETKVTGKARAADAGTAQAAVAAPSEETAQKAADGLLINGSVNNAATSQYTLAARFGNTASGKALYQFVLDVQESNSALDAKAYSITGFDIPKPQTNQLTGGFAVMGPLKIPGVLKRGPQMFVGYQRVENGVAVSTAALVPTLAQRSGDVSGEGVTVLDPVTHQPVRSVTPNPVAAALLALYPLPNQPLTNGYNFEAPLVTDTHIDQMNSNANKTVGRRDQIFGSFALQSSRTSNTNIFNWVDAQRSLGMNAQVNWSHTLTQRYRTSVAYTFSRYGLRTTPYWENRGDVSGAAGIEGNDHLDPVYEGPPSLSFANGIATLSDANALRLRNMTHKIVLVAKRNGTQHNLTAGVEFSRREFNYLQQANPRGSFSFTQGTTSATGSAFADFLYGIPDTATVNFGNADKYLRETLTNVYVTDDWRVAPQFTVNAGLRWEYQGPISEIKDRLVNVDVAPGFSQAAPVVATQPQGPVTGQTFPRSLLRPDYTAIQPRVALSWRPIPASSLVVTAGYGIYYDTSVYQSLAIQMAQQAPLTKSLDLQYDPAACPLTLETAFNQSCGLLLPQTFGVDPNFQVGYLQTWNLKVQRDLPGSLQMVATYLGNKGTRGVQEFLPQTVAPVSTSPSCTGPCGYLYLSSTGESTRESGSLQLRRRLKSGFTANVLYTYSKSLDDDAALGGQGAAVAAAATVAQDWRNLRGERGLSPFDQRHVLNASAQYTTGMGLHGGTLLSGWRGVAYKEWTVEATLTAASGLPETPVVSGIALAGHASVVRPNVTGQPIDAAANGFFVNRAAFSVPAPGTFGNARRDSIEGPRQLTLDAAMLRTFRLPDKMTLDVQVAASNVLNHVTYAGWVTNINSAQFGAPAGANTMRVVSVSGRFRF